jgi:SET domain-containing protein
MDHSELIYVKRVNGKGRGVFARQTIRKGTLIEHVPVIVVPLGQVVGGKHNPFLSQYCFVRTRWSYAVALGYGSLYNHSYEPNARYSDGPASTMYFRALRTIDEGEEITVNYNGNPKDRSPLWFDVVE